MPAPETFDLPDTAAIGFRTEGPRGPRAAGAPGLAPAAAGLVFVGMLPYGSASRSPALLLALYWMVLFGWAALVKGPGLMWTRAAPLRVPAILFGVVLLIGVLQLTPWLPGGPNPVWQSVPGAWPAVTLQRDSTLAELVKLVGLAAAFLTGIAIGADGARTHIFFRGVCWGSLALAIGALVVWQLQPGEWLGTTHSSGPARLTAPFWVADSTAAAFGLLCLLNAAALRSSVTGDRSASQTSAWLGRSQLNALVPLLGLIICAFDLYLTASRGGLAATIFAALVMAGTALFRAARRRTGPVAVTVLVVCAIVVLCSLAVAMQPALLNAREGDPSSGLLLDRVARIGQDAVERLTVYQVHIRAAAARPWFGYGLGTWPAINDLYLAKDNYELLWRIRSAHNLYLQWIEEAGSVGAAFMFGTVSWVLVAIARSIFTAQRRRLTLDAVLACAVLLIAHGAIDYSLQQPAIASLLALLLGVGYALSGRRG